MAAIWSVRAPVAGERRDRTSRRANAARPAGGRPPEDVAIDAEHSRRVLFAARASARLAMRMMLPAGRLDRLDLRFVGGDHVVDRDGSGEGSSWSVPAPQAMTAPGLLFALRQWRASKAPAHSRPGESHAALRRVHRLGDTEAKIPEMMAEGEGALPVEGGVERTDRCRRAGRRRHAPPRRRRD